MRIPCNRMLRSRAQSGLVLTRKRSESNVLLSAAPSAQLPAEEPSCALAGGLDVAAVAPAASGRHPSALLPEDRPDLGPGDDGPDARRALRPPGTRTGRARPADAEICRRA